MKIALTKIRRALTPQPPSERMRPSTAEPARAVAPAIDQHDGIYNLYDEIHKLELKKVEKALLCDDFEAKLNREPKNSPDRNLFSEMWIRHNDDLKEIKSQLAALNAQKLGPLYPKDEQLGTTNITTISFLCLKCVSNPSQTVVESFNQMRSCIHTLLNVPMEPEVVYAESVKNDLAALKLHSHNLIPHELISIISVAPELFFLNRINVFESMDSGLQALFRKVCEEAKVDLVSLQAAEHQLGEILETKLLNYPFPDPWSLFLQDGAPVIMSPPKGVTASHFSSGTAQPIGFLNKAMNTALKTAFGSAGLQSGFRPDRLFDCSTRSVVLTSSFQIQTAVEYFCVSHVWGTTQDLLAADFGISAITWKIPISSSGKLNDILMLMKTSGIQYWWMDILCIDQDNISDKNAQVSVMGNIYANGSGTMVYETSLDPENFDAFRVVYNFCMKLKMFSSMQPNNLVWRPNELILHIGTAIQQESLALLAGLLNASDWETRVWTLQEKMLSRIIVVVVKLRNDDGHIYINQRILQQMVVGTNQLTIPYTYLKTLHKRKKMPEDPFLSFYSICEQWLTWINSIQHQAADLRTSTRWLSTRACYLPEDRVFGAKWLLSHDIDVQYGANSDSAVQEIYQRTAISRPSLLIGVPQSENKVFKSKWLPSPNLGFSSTLPVNLEEFFACQGLTPTNKGLEFKKVPVLQISSPRDTQHYSLIPIGDLPLKIFFDLSICPPFKPFSSKNSYSISSVHMVGEDMKSFMLRQVKNLGLAFNVPNVDVWSSCVQDIVASMPLDQKTPVPATEHFQAVYLILNACVQICSENPRLEGLDTNLMGLFLVGWLPIFIQNYFNNIKAHGNIVASQALLSNFLAKYNISATVHLCKNSTIAPSFIFNIRNNKSGQIEARLIIEFAADNVAMHHVGKVLSPHLDADKAGNLILVLPIQEKSTSTLTGWLTRPIHGSGLLLVEPLAKAILTHEIKELQTKDLIVQ